MQEQQTPPASISASPSKTIKVYVASKLKYADRLKYLRGEWVEYGINLHARWFDQAILETSGEVDDPEDFHIFWLVDEDDVATSDVVLVYGEPEDHLRGALVEAGMAIALKKLVVVIADSPDYGTWQHHPQVAKARSFDHAKDMILCRFG